MYNYKAFVNRVVDGDTIDVIIDLGFGVLTKERIRLLGIDTPEIRTKDLVEKAEGLKAKEFVENAILLEEVTIVTYKDSKGKFGRYLAEVLYFKDKLFEDLTHLNDELVELGLAKIYGDNK
jgi:micrococcal nuclease